MKLKINFWIGQNANLRKITVGIVKITFEVLTRKGPLL
jgi:hypothetical protein